jgi:hypothetical protein
VKIGDLVMLAGAKFPSSTPHHVKCGTGVITGAWKNYATVWWPKIERSRTMAVNLLEIVSESR